MFKTWTLQINVKRPVHKILVSLPIFLNSFLDSFLSVLQKKTKQNKTVLKTKLRADDAKLPHEQKQESELKTYISNPLYLHRLLDMLGDKKGERRKRKKEKYRHNNNTFRGKVFRLVKMK